MHVIAFRLCRLSTEIANRKGQCRTAERCLKFGREVTRTITMESRIVAFVSGLSDSLIENLNLRLWTPPDGFNMPI